MEAEILKCDKTITELKELSVYVQNYQKYKFFDKHYRAAKDPEGYNEGHESQLMIFDAAVRHMRESGLDPSRVTYGQVMDGIQRMQKKSDGLKEKYRALREEVRDMEKQRELITEYLGKERKMEHQAPMKKPKQKVL